MSDSLIIGVHGLMNKPAKANHAALWVRAMQDGLQRNAGLSPPPPLAFDLVDWADVVHGPQRLPDWTYPAWSKPGPFPNYADGVRDALREQAQDLLDTPLDMAKRWIGADPVGDRLLAGALTDLRLYYQDRAVNRELRARLRQLVEAAYEDGKRLMVIGHSMGSIIAYDTLREIGRERQDLAITHLVTLGSPLGLPTVKFRIWQENDQVRTPTVVRRWTNLAERRDAIAFDTHLAGDFLANAQGIRVEDDLVCNDTVPERDDPTKTNYHDLFGYLRTPEMSRIIRAFL